MSLPTWIRSCVRAAVPGLALAAGACVRAPGAAPLPERSRDALAVYRTIAESVYVRTAGRSVAIVTAGLDTACGGAACRPLLARWGLDPLWWARGDSSSAREARSDLLSRSASPLVLAQVPEGQRLLQSMAPDSAAAVLAAPDTAHWQAFKEAHGGAAGFLRFSSVGFDRSRDAAIVLVEWECGPACGHVVAVALGANGAGAWRIDDMLLVSSRAPRPGIGTP